MRDNSWERRNERRHRRVEDSVRIIEEGLEWLRNEALSRDYGHVEIELTLHDGAVKSVRRTISEHVGGNHKDESQR